MSPTRYSSRLVDPKKDAFYGYNMADGLRKYRAALAEYDTKIIHGIYLGDSIVVGTNASDAVNKSAHGRLRTILQNKYGACGEGIISVNDTRWVQTGTWVAGTGTGGANASKYATGATNKMTLTFTGTAFDVVYSIGSLGGTASVVVDGVTQGATINCYTSGAFTYGQVAHYSGFSNASHTVDIVAPATNYIWLEAIVPYTASTGIMLHKIGQGGMQSNGKITTNDVQFAINIGASLVIYEFGVNDCIYATSSDAFYSNMKTTINNMTGLAPSILLQVNNTGNPAYNAAFNNWAQYVSQYYRVADELNCALLSVYDKWGRNWATADGLGLLGTSHDYVHPGDKGYNDIAMVLGRHLLAN